MIHDHKTRFWSEAPQVLHPFYMTLFRANSAEALMDVHAAQLQPSWDEDECEMMMHSTVNNQPWADWGEGKVREGREGSLSCCFELWIWIASSETVNCHCRHISVVADLCWFLQPVSIFGLDPGLKGIVWHFSSFASLLPCWWSGDERVSATLISVCSPRTYSQLLLSLV